MNSYDPSTTVLSTNEQGQSEQVLAGFQLSTDPPKKEGFGDSPLEDFWGTGCGFLVKGGQGRARVNPDGTQSPGRPWQRVYFNFIGVEVLASSEPYPHPTASFSLFYSDPEDSYKRREGQGMNEWEAWCEPMRALGLGGMGGFNKLFGGQVMAEGQQPGSPGMRMHIKRVPTLIQVGPDVDGAAQAAANGDKALYDKLKGWHPEVKMPLRIIEVEGVGTWSPSEVIAPPSNNGTVPQVTEVTPVAMPGSSVNIVEYVLNLANGKTVNQFYQAAADDTTVMSNPMLVNQVTSRTYHENMVNLGRLRLDGDVLTRVS